MASRPDGDVWNIVDNDKDSQHYGRNFKFDFSYISSEEIKDVRARFGIAQDSKPAPEALAIQANIRREVVYFAEYLATEVEPSRELSLALTHLEEALMWSGKAVFK